MRSPCFFPAVFALASGGAFAGVFFAMHASSLCSAVTLA